MKVETRQYTVNDQTAVRLAEIYIEKTEYACAVAKVCDNILDRSGGLLGIVRERAQELKSAKLRANNSQSMPCCQEFHQWCIDVKGYCHCPQCGLILF